MVQTRLIAPMIAQHPRANSDTDIDTHPLSDIGDPIAELLNQNSGG